MRRSLFLPDLCCCCSIYARAEDLSSKALAPPYSSLPASTFLEQCVIGRVSRRQIRHPASYASLPQRNPWTALYSPGLWSGNRVGLRRTTVGSLKICIEDLQQYIAAAVRSGGRN
jgi:hypothetical protein